MAEEDWVVQPSLEVCATQCGATCCKEPGYIALTFPEAQELFLTDKLRIEVTNAHGTFRMENTERVYLLFADQPHGRCPYLDLDDGCAIHDSRPQACRTFPDFPAEYCLVWPEVHAKE